MNKKLFLGMFAATGMLLATSCSNDELNAVQSGNEAQVAFSLGLEGGIATRTISDGKSADKLVYAVYDADKKLISTIETVEKNNVTFPTSETITLAKGQTYTVVFWAQDADCSAYTVTTEEDGIKVAVDYEGNNNDETRDAFFKAETFTVSGDAEIDVELKRPFAQINVGVTEEDWEAAVASGVTITESKVVIKNAATSINLLDGSVSGETPVTYDFATIPALFESAETLEVDVDRDGTIEDEEKYKYLSMSYILVNDENGGANKATLEADGLKFTFSPATGEDIVFDKGLQAVPVQRNWRTNIIGKLLTGGIQFNISIDPIYDDDYNYPEFEDVEDGVKYDAANKTYYLYSVAGLQWLSNQTNDNANQFSGYTVKLTSDVDLTNIAWTPIGTANAFLGTFDGGNNTISNLTVNVTDDNAAAGLFASACIVKNVKMSNVNISGHYKAGAIVGDGLCSRIENCHVDGGKIISTPNSLDNNANNVGGIVGYLSAEPTAYVKNSSVKNLTITAYRSVGGIAGRTLGQAAVVENCVVDNVVVIADMVAEYAETGKESAAGMVVGDNRANSDLSSNTTNNVTVNVYSVKNSVATVGTATGLNYALGQGYTAVLAEDVTAPLAQNAIYGTPLGVVMKNGGVIDGNGFSLDILNPQYNGYAIETYGGTIKNLTIDTPVGRGIVISSPESDVYIDNVVIDGPGYAINTTEHNEKKLIVTNSTVKGWTSLAGLDAASFTNCNFGENSYKYWQKNGYDADYDRLIRPYISTTITECVFEQNFYIDLSALATDAKVTLKDCKCGEVEITAANYESYITIELPNGRTVADCVVFE